MFKSVKLCLLFVGNTSLMKSATFIIMIMVLPIFIYRKLGQMEDSGLYKSTLDIVTEREIMIMNPDIDNPMIIMILVIVK